jgi:hypothetical protein
MGDALHSGFCGSELRWHDLIPVVPTLTADWLSFATEGKHDPVHCSRLDDPMLVERKDKSPAFLARTRNLHLGPCFRVKLLCFFRTGRKIPIRHKNATIISFNYAHPIRERLMP